MSASRDQPAPSRRTRDPMQPQRASVKFFLSEPRAVDADAVVGVFHRWIQQNTLEGLAIDVADYRHVCPGPGVLLVGHTFDCALDVHGDRPGLRYVRKRRDGADATLSLAVRGALLACRHLEQELVLRPPLRFATEEAEVAILDRLRAPNTAEAAAAVRDQIAAILAPLYAPASLHIEPASPDTRTPLTMRIRAPGAPNLAELVRRLGPAGPPPAAGNG
jgi:hypothetical protein